MKLAAAARHQAKTMSLSERRVRQEELVVPKDPLSTVFADENEEGSGAEEDASGSESEE